MHTFLNKVFTVVLLLTILNSVKLSAQTTVSGGIYQNTTWTLAGSPYLMTGSIVVFPGNTLTIEPGVQVIVTADNTFNTGNFIYLELRGALVAIGTISQPIVFTSTDTTVGFYNWMGVRIKGSQGGNVQMNNIELHNSWYGIHNDISEPGISYTFDNCLFRSNNCAIQLNANLIYNNCAFIQNGVGQAAQISYGYMTANNCTFNDNFCSVTWSNGINIKGCTFTGNQNNIIGCPGLIDSCQFFNNTYAFAQCGGLNITNSLFVGNGTGVEGESSCTIANSVFETNAVAIRIGDNGVVTNNQISNNDVGVQVTAYTPNSTIIENNIICSNTIHNLENLTDKNYQVNLNCFCSQDSTVIENGIYDGYDDITRGLVNYAIYDDSCQTIISFVTKVQLGGTTGLLELNNPMKVWYYNQELTIQSASNSLVSILDVTGKIIQVVSINSESTTIDTSLNPGVYFIRSQEGYSQRFVVTN
jgi:hypothetical protein